MLLPYFLVRYRRGVGSVLFYLVALLIAILANTAIAELSSNVEPPARHRDFNTRLVLNPTTQFYSIDHKMQVLNSDYLQDFLEVKKSSDWIQWQPNSAFIRGQPFWLRFSLYSFNASTWQLKLSDSTIEQAELYVVIPSKLNKKNGNPEYQKVLLTNEGLDTTLPVSLEPNQLTEIYLKVNGQHQPFLQFELWNNKELADYQSRQMFTYGAFLGGCLLLVALLIAAALVTRHSSIYVQLLYVLLTLCAHLTSQGFIQKFFFPENQYAINQISFCFSGFVFALGLSLLRVMSIGYMPPVATRCYYIVAMVSIGVVTILTFLNSLILQQLVYFIGIGNMIIGLLTLLSLKVFRHMSFRFMMLGFVLGLLGYMRYIGWLNMFDSNSFERSNALTLGLISHLIFIVCGSFIEVRQVLATRLKDKLNAMEALHQQRLIEQQATQQAFYDVLTGCPNRKALQHAMEKKIQQDAKSQFGLILICLGHFKEINNTLGHNNGDELLKRIATQLNQVVSQLPSVVNFEVKNAELSHLVSLEGMIFGVLLESVEQSMLVSICEHIQQCLNQPFECQLMCLDITGFLGIACYPEHGRNSVDILQHAHVAIEIAQLRDQHVVFYSAELDPYSARRLTLVSELKNALRNGDLQLYFQPQVDLCRREVIGVEALIRWRHPVHGFISPQEFIPIAEKTGVIRQLTAWVIDESMKQAQQFYQQGLWLRVSVNLSAKNLYELELPNTVFASLKRYGIPANMLCFEITETAMMLDPSRSMRTIFALYDCGIRLSIDDFGTGYSSLAYLKSLPVNEIKIDRSFVTEMCQGNDDQVIVRTTLNMSHNLSKEVVAEGIEDEKTYKALLDLGCDIGQGYYISRPVPIAKLIEWLSSCDYSVRKISGQSARSSSHQDRSDDQQGSVVKLVYSGAAKRSL